MNSSSKVLVALLGAFAVSGGCFAQDAASSSSTHSMGSMSGMHGNMAMHHVQGMHKMPATVSSVDTKTGLVEADAEGMSLKVHFPPASVADLKAGDKITLHMGYTKP